MSSKRQYQFRELLFPVYLPSALFSIAEGAIIPILPASAQALGANLATAAIVTGLIMIGTLIADIPAAKLVHRLGERAAMILAAFVAVVGISLAYFADTIWQLGLGVFLLGATAAIFGLARHAYVAETVPFEYRARSLSILGGVFRFGAFAGPMIGAGLIALFSTRSVFLCSIALSAIAGLLLLITRPEKMAKATVPSTTGIIKIANQNRHKLLTLGLASGMLTMARTARNIGLPLWALHIKMDLSHSTLIIGIAAAVDVALFFVGGKAIDQRGRRFAAVPTMVAVGLGLALIPFSTNVVTFFLVALFLSLGNAMGAGLVMVIGADLAPEGRQNQFLASYRFLLDLGVASAAPVLSIMTAVASLASGLYLIGGVSIAGAWLMHKYLPHHGIR